MAQPSGSKNNGGLWQAPYQLKTHTGERKWNAKMNCFNRKRNTQTPTGEPYELAFTQTEVIERGWTVSMVRRHLGKPNAVLHYPLTYQFDRRRVYAAEATPGVQFDLLATEDVHLLGLRWLSRYAAYVLKIQRASLLTRAARTEDKAESEMCAKLAAKLPSAKTPATMPVPPARPAPRHSAAKLWPAPPCRPRRPNGHQRGTQRLQRWRHCPPHKE